MPQMAPINWIILFIIFLLTYFLFNVMNYYIYSPMIKKSKTSNIKNNFLNWKW